MAIGRTNTGGTNPLNYSVVGGTTQPANPKENTIWVKTGTAFADYHIIPFQPGGTGSQPEGTVWINFDISGGKVYINILKKNRILAYLGAVKQYENGAWADKEAYVYMNGSWVQFSEIITDLYLYNKGSTCSDVTGGWANYNGNSTVTNGSSAMTVKANGNYESGGAKTVRAIDVTDFNTLIFNGAIVSGTGFSDFVIRLTQNGTVTASVTSGASVSLDISNLVGAHTVEIYCSNSGSGGRTITVSEIYLTK